MKNIDELCVDELRVLSNEMITNAGSGHPGIALGSAPIIYSLFANVMAINSEDEKNFNRDRLVLSAGHASSILYATLHAMGFDISKEDLMNFRKLGSKTPGHPEIDVVPGVDASTGPLGQGVANAVGMAMAEKHFEAKFNKKDLKLFDNKIYCLVGEGCLMEGISYEALSLAGTLNLNNLVVIYDCNKISIEGNTDMTFVDDIEKRFDSIGFDVKKVKDGNNVGQITKTLLSVQKAKQPTLVIVPTIIGYGSELAGNQKIHGSPLSEEMLEKLKINLLVSKPKFDLSTDAKKYFQQKQIDAKNRLLKRDNLQEYKKKYQKEFKEFKAIFDENMQEKLVDRLKKLQIDEKNEKSTTRDINFDVLNLVAQIIANMFGGSADVATSTKAYLKSENYFSEAHYESNFVHYGIREHAMAGISNGLAIYGGILPYQSCFLSFFDYLKPALRMSALQNLRVLSIFSHDSITAGQDGPTHQPIEQLPSLRLVPNMIVSRPYNSAEILATYIWLLKNKKPTCMLVSKDKMNFLQSNVEDALKGGYVLKEQRKSDITLVSTGADVDRCIKVSEMLAKKNIECRIVSMPCISMFESQTTQYQKSVLKTLPKVFVEASAENHWLLMADKSDLIININQFGKSGSPDEVSKYFKIDEDNLTKRILTWHKNQKNRTKKLKNLKIDE